MNLLKISPDQLKLLDTLGETHNLGSRKAIYVPYVLVQHDLTMPDVFELVPMSPVLLEQWNEFRRLYDDIAIS